MATGRSNFDALSSMKNRIEWRLRKCVSPSRSDLVAERCSGCLVRAVAFPDHSALVGLADLAGCPADLGCFGLVGSP